VEALKNTLVYRAEKQFVALAEQMQQRGAEIETRLEMEIAVFPLRAETGTASVVTQLRSELTHLKDRMEDF
jgi:hypothetical protein